MHDGETIEVAGVRWWLRAGLAAGELAPRLASALGQLASAPDLRAGRRKRLFRLALAEAAAPDHLLKRSADPCARSFLRRALGSKARRELAIAQALAARGVPVVLPLAAGERRRGARLVEGFLLAPLVPGARDLRALWASDALAARERRRLLTSLGALIRAAHAAGLHQHDLAPNNVLVGAATDGELRLIDFERARLRRRAGERARRRMLAKLARAAGDLSAAQRLRFLRAYAGDGAGARAWWGRLREEAPRLARRDDTRMRRSATRPGRRFAPVALAGWRGHARRDAAFAGALSAGAEAPLAAGERVRVVPAAGSWSVVHALVSARRARRLWARANTLAARGLAPTPLACVSDRARTLLVVAAEPGMQPLAPSAEAQCALAHLLAQLGALGELEAELASVMFALVPGRGGRLRALLLAPDAFRFTGRAGSARSRAAAARLLAALEPRGAPPVQFVR